MAPPLTFSGPAATAVWSMLHDPRCALGHTVEAARSVNTGQVTIEQPDWGLRAVSSSSGRRCPRSPSSPP